MKRIIIKCSDDPAIRGEWRKFCAHVDDEADYEEIVAKLLQYFEEDDDRVTELRATDRLPEFR